MFFLFVGSLVLRFALGEGCALFLAFGVLCSCLFISQPTAARSFGPASQPNQSNFNPTGFPTPFGVTGCIRVFSVLPVSAAHRAVLRFSVLIVAAFLSASGHARGVTSATCPLAPDW